MRLNGFGIVLKHDKYKSEWGWKVVINILRGSRKLLPS
jgi:hypothetical protein